MLNFKGTMFEEPLGGAAKSAPFFRARKENPKKC
jgi:hypothetical protein